MKEREYIAVVVVFDWFVVSSCLLHVFYNE
jgi:hypothetical protein